VSRFAYDDYVSMTMEFRCNLRCVHCMIEGTMDRLQPESDAAFEQILATNAAERKWQGIIFTGSEITLRKDLPDLARRARAHGFSHVRIQTHGVHLADRDYCDMLVEAGVDEYFVSVTAPDAETHDAITRVPKAFERMMQGFDNLERHSHVTVVTNTVVTALSYRLLPAVVERLSHLKCLVQMEFWAYWPMKEQDDKNLIVRHSDSRPYLLDAIRRAWALGRDVEVKNFPHCLLDEARDALVNGQPELHVDPAFWAEFMRNGFHQCVHREVCGSTECLGLNTAYVNRFGYEATLLSPMSAPRTEAAE
jgi:MoaA/NifB/PqqE/SkfB family radical SAM enzyme